MATYTYAPNAVLHPDTGEPVTFSSGKVYGINDTDMASAIEVVNALGMSTSEILVRNGASETFLVDDVIAVLWVDDNDPTCIVALQPVLPGLPGGGIAGQVLSKVTSEDYDVSWVNPGVPTEGSGGPLAAGRVDYAIGSSAARPTDDVNILVMWIADAPPVNALQGDIWLNAPS